MATAARESAPARQAPRAAPRRRTPGPIWLATLAVLGLCAWLVWFYLRATKGWSVPAATPLGRWYGGVGVGIMLILVLYNVRHAAYRRRLGSLELWYRTHLWLGVIALALVGVHCGFHCRGLFLTLLQIFFWSAMASGLLGWLLQSGLKRVLMRREERPIVMSEIARERETARQTLVGLITEAILREANQRAQTMGAPVPTKEEAEAVAQKEVQAALRAVAAVRSRNFWRFPSRETWRELVRSRGRPVLAHHLNDLEPAESAAALEEMDRINRLETWASYHRWLRGWTTLHLALTLGLLQLVLWHIYMTTAY
jgi:hypothetical protein